MTTMLYRPADKPNDQVWGRYVEHAVLEEADVAAALAEGWSVHPDDVGAKPVRARAAVPTPKRRGRPQKEG